ncbi:hypothetical protein [uncultured Arthrobacter sp.]|uniref:hypothetical protein n=1 Tax=uncultured Arthrobacter sp. TaxID=114050 RepID=UPI00260869EA|nr:hypothetical protein [uncultured Arthrobacter sp.]
MGKLVAGCAVALVCVGMLSGCSLARGAPEREEVFAVQGGECAARWWLEPLVEEVPDEASDVAGRALTDAVVSTAELEEWKEILLDSQSDDRPIPGQRLEGLAYVEVVRAAVRSELAESGYPDAPTRLIEVYSDVDCS